MRSFLCAALAKRRYRWYTGRRRRARVSYAYDAWGNILSISGPMASTVGEINPFRYKGRILLRQ